MIAEYITHRELGRGKVLSKYTRNNIESLLLPALLSDDLENHVTEYLKDKSIQTRKMAVWHFQDFCKWAENPLNSLQRPSYWLDEYPKRPLLVTADYKRLQRYKMTEMQRLLIGLLCETPLQREELRLLKKDNFYVDTVKIGDRRIPISPELSKLIAKSFKKKKRTYLFSLTDNPPSANRLQKMLNDILIRAGLKTPGVSFRLFRQSYMLNSDLHPDTLQQVSGFSQRNNFRARFWRLRPQIIRLYETALFQARDRRFRGIKDV